MTQFKFIDLFAGIGGFRTAMTSLGGECVFSCEIDKYCQKVYEYNYGDIPFGDITQLDEKEVPDHDILLGGFPCQALSIAGKRGGFEDTRGTLFFDVARIIKEKRPKAFILENVKGLINHNKGNTLEVILETLRNDLDYYVPDPEIVNAKDFGVPQNRERIFIVGFRNDLGIKQFSYPKPTGLIVKVEDILEKSEVPAKYYLSERYLETLKNHRSRHESKGNGFGYTVLDKDGVSNAIVVGGMGHERNLVFDDRLTDFTVSGNKGELNKEFIRKMTPREWARLQGFPEQYDFSCVSDTQAYKQFGNSVAIPAVKAVGEKVLEKLGYEKKDIDINNIYIEKREGTIMGKDTKNKGEWSELYVFLKIAGEGKLDVGDSKLQINTDEYYKVYKIIRESDNREFSIGEDIVEVSEITNNINLINVPKQHFIETSQELFKEMIAGSSTFKVEKVKEFLNNIGVINLKGSNSEKDDILMDLEKNTDLLRKILSFSIKSQVGSPATILNASQKTNFIYEVKDIDLSDEDIENLNKGNQKSIIKSIKDRNGKFEFISVNDKIFEDNLRSIDYLMPSVLSELLLYTYSTSTKGIKEVFEKVDLTIPNGYSKEQFSTYILARIKNMLYLSATTMITNDDFYSGHKIDGGMIIVKSDGQLLCYDLYNLDRFKDYLYQSLKFESASKSRHKYGKLYKEDDKIKFKLNLQIRYK